MIPQPRPSYSSRNRSSLLSCTAPGMEPRWGTPVLNYVAGLPPDARPSDKDQPRDEDTEGGKPADKSLINRRLSAPSPALCSTTTIKNCPPSVSGPPLAAASSIDSGHKS